MTEERAKQLLERRAQALPEGRAQALQEGATAVVTGGGERWRDRNGERRSYGRGREKALPKEESAGVTEGGKPGKPGEPDSRVRVAAPANTLPNGPTTTRIPDSPSPLSIDLDLTNDEFPPARLV